MVVGTICFATRSGLGLLAKSFVDHGVIQRILVVQNAHFVNHTDWYPPEQAFSKETVDDFLRGLDVLLLFEQFFDVDTVVRAKRQGVKLVMMPMYECTPARLAVEMDAYICPSELDLHHYRDRGACYIPVPVDVPWRLCETARVFVHNAGHGGMGYRNGTPELFEALKYLKSDVTFIVRGQPKSWHIEKLFKSFAGDPRVTLTLADVPDEELWATGDVFVFPEKFNGLSLPMQEAFATGMLVMGTDRFPMNRWLPKEPLLPVPKYNVDRMAVNVSKAVVDPVALAKHIDSWYGRDITEWSLKGREWAKRHSWEVLGPMYRDALSRN